MKPQILLILALSSLVCSAADSPTEAPPRAKLTVRVLDEERAPLPGALVRMSFREKASTQQALVSGRTDNNGEFTGEGYSDVMLDADARKEGYYLSGAASVIFTNSENDRLQPWNPTFETVLRKVEKPVAMYARRAWVEVPDVNKPCGYDLKAGDWVKPWGRGEVADFVFTLHRVYVNRDQFDVSIDLTFSNPLDGIQQTELPREYAQSWFIWPRQSPDNGYINRWRSEFGAPSHLHSLEDIQKQKFFFRVRTVEKDGQIVSALYGKLAEGFQLAPSDSKTCAVRLNYYLNPTPLDRNMEFDLKKNLLKNPGIAESPNNP